MMNFAPILHCLAEDESGAILSAELVLVLTIAVLSMVVGISELASSINSELFDLSQAFCSLNQTFATPSFFGCRPKGGFFLGSRYVDINTCGYCQQIGAPGFAGPGDIVTGPAFVDAPAAPPAVYESTPVAPPVAPAPLPAPEVCPPAPVVAPQQFICVPVPAQCDCPTALPVLKAPSQEEVPEAGPKPADANPAPAKPGPVKPDAPRPAYQ